MMSARLAALAKRRPSRIGLRLLAFNLLLVFLPVAGILYLDVYESQLLEAQERSMVQQGRLVSAALGENELTSDAANGLLTRLGRRGDARIRIYDVNGSLLADSARVLDSGAVEHTGSEGASEYDKAVAGVRQRPLYRLGAWLAGLRRAARRLIVSSLQTPADGGSGSAQQPLSELRAALEGRYGATTRGTPGQRSLTLNSAVPVRSGDRVIGAVLVSQSTLRVLQPLYEVRLRIFQIVVASVVAAVLLGWLMSTTIVRPLVRLRRTAVALADRRATPGSFANVNRRDEIGDLSRTLEDLTTRLDAHIRLLESFAAEVSHEFKNPLASIRTAAEMIAVTEDASDRERLLGMLIRDVDRLVRLVTGVRELARIDAQLAHDAIAPIDVVALLQEIVRGFELHGQRVVLVRDTNAPLPFVRGTADRLAQVFENLLQNASSFAPPESSIEIDVKTVDRSCVVTVADRGPGIPPAHLARVFERFFSYRPDDGARREHTGLGLAIAKAIIEGYGGTIGARNRNQGGAVFEVRLPFVRGPQVFSGVSHAVSVTGTVSKS